MEKPQVSRPRRVGRKRQPGPDRLDREERQKILRVQNLLAKAHSSPPFRGAAHARLTETET
jgi:hypothetical protein